MFSAVRVFVKLTKRTCGNGLASAPFHAVEEVVGHGTPTGESDPAAPSSAGGKDRLRV